MNEYSDSQISGYRVTDLPQLSTVNNDDVMLISHKSDTGMFESQRLTFSQLAKNVKNKQFRNELAELAEISENYVSKTTLNKTLTAYSKTNHNHDTVYSKTNHNHDTVYSKLEHDHDAVYSKTNHTHDDVYSKLGHKHDNIYSLIDHNHDTAYAQKTHFHEEYQTIISAEAAYTNLQTLCKTLSVEKADVNYVKDAVEKSHNHDNISILSTITNKSVSQWNNDSGYITEHQSLSDYMTSADTVKYMSENYQITGTYATIINGRSPNAVGVIDIPGQRELPLVPSADETTESFMSRLDGLTSTISGDIYAGNISGFSDMPVRGEYSIQAAKIGNVWRLVAIDVSDNVWECVYPSPVWRRRLVCTAGSDGTCSPVEDDDAVTKKYVDAAVTSVHTHNNMSVLSTIVNTDISQWRNNVGYAPSSDINFVYDSDNKTLKLTVCGKPISVDTAEFIRAGMIESVIYDESMQRLIITFNTVAGLEPINVPLTAMTNKYNAGDGLILNGDTFSICSNYATHEWVSEQGFIGKNDLNEYCKTSTLETSVDTLNEEIDSKADISHSHILSDITDYQKTFMPVKVMSNSSIPQIVQMSCETPVCYFNNNQATINITKFESNATKDGVYTWELWCKNAVAVSDIRIAGSNIYYVGGDELSGGHIKGQVPPAGSTLVFAVRQLKLGSINDWNVNFCYQYGG